MLCGSIYWPKLVNLLLRHLELFLVLAKNCELVTQKFGVLGVVLVSSGLIDSRISCSLEVYMG